MSNYLNETTDQSTRSDDPEVIRRDIEATRADLSRDVDALTEKVSPARVMERRVDRAKSAVGSVKEKVMGDGAATAAPSAARQKTQGNPMAAGLIAFGAGWLFSSLLPATEKEKQAATTVKDKAGEHSDTLTAPLKEAAGNAKENLQGPAQDAVASVKDKATDAASTVKDEAASAKDDVAGSAQQAKDQVTSSNGSTSY
jgi:uncharacterized protein YjbJ (UPF0337 family)